MDYFGKSHIDAGYKVAFICFENINLKCVKLHFKHENLGNNKKPITFVMGFQNLDSFNLLE